MIDPIADAYGTLIIWSLSSLVEGDYAFDKLILGDIDINPFLELYKWEPVKMLSMYVLLLRPSNIYDLSP